MVCKRLTFAQPQQRGNDMSLKNLMISAVVALCATPAAMAFEPESEDPIKFMVGDWTSIALQGEIMQLILQTYGYNTDTVQADDSGRYPGFEAGDLDVAMETWQTTQEENFMKSVATGNVLDMGETGLKAREDWWYPSYVKDLCPGLPDWEALKTCGELFSTADTAPKGRYISGPTTWGGYDDERVVSLGLPFEVIHAGSDAAMFAELKSAYERKEPILVWVWVPNWTSSVYEGEFVDFPKYDPACYSDPAWGVNPDGIADCAKPTGWVKKMAWAGGEQKWPCAYDMVRKYHMDNDTLNKMLLEVDVNGRDRTEVATEWLKANEAVWKPWAACAG
jgi:glycine betaine/proline transport system substrate-binding protein